MIMCASFLKLPYSLKLLLLAFMAVLYLLLFQVFFMDLFKSPPQLKSRSSGSFVSSSLVSFSGNDADEVSVKQSLR